VYPRRVPPDWKAFRARPDAHAKLPDDDLYLVISEIGPALVDVIKKGPDKGHWRIDEVRSRVGSHVDVVAVDSRSTEVPALLHAYLGLGQTLVLLGSSGAGKSTLTNNLLGCAIQDTGAVRAHDSRGKHTTTATHLYWMPTETSANLALVRKTGLIDSPGFQEFGLHHINPDQLPRLMPDIQRHTGDCRFYNCTHLHEPGCKVIAAVSSNSDDDPDAQPPLHPISAVRYRLYCSLMTELSQPIRY
jgi:putative ribosome biogenesis GTPase RsgA